MKRFNRRGQTVMMFTLAAVPLFGMLGLVVDIGWAYFRKEAAQTASDAAANAAALAAYSAAAGGAPTCTTTGVTCYATEYTCPSTFSATPADNIEAGCMYARDNGFVSTGKQKVTFQSGVGNSPTASGATTDYWIIVRVTERVPQLFSRVLGVTDANVTARTTTGTRVASAGGCVIVLNPTASGAISMNGTTNLTSGCGVFDNSNAPDALSIVGGGTITTSGGTRTNIVGNWSGSGVISPAPVTGSPVLSDPFADMNPPPVGGCTDGGSGISLGSHQSQSINATTMGVICGGINLSAQSSLSLAPGVYVVKNGISLGGQTSLSGTGVTLYIQSGAVTMAGGATVSLSAPTTGTWQGILFYQDRNDTADSTLVGGTTQQMNGVLYFPKSHLSYTGGSGTVATQTTIVSDTLTLVGNSFISAAATSNFTGVSGGILMVE